MTIASSDAYFRQFLGRQFPGGCDDCSAYQTFRQIETGVWNLRTHHDDTCPTYRRIQDCSR